MDSWPGRSSSQHMASLTLCKALLLGSGHPTTLEGGGAAHTRPLSLLRGPHLSLQILLRVPAALTSGVSVPLPIHGGLYRDCPPPCPEFLSWGTVPQGRKSFPPRGLHGEGKRDA